jgi:hypothetical protein
MSYARLTYCFKTHRPGEKPAKPTPQEERDRKRQIRAGLRGAMTTRNNKVTLPEVGFLKRDVPDE